MISHPHLEFHAMKGVIRNFKALFQSINDLLVLTGSGTWGCKTALLNSFVPEADITVN